MFPMSRVAAFDNRARLFNKAPRKRTALERGEEGGVGVGVR